MDTVDLFLAGDVMTGRGVDQILPHPGDPALREPLIRDARRYVRLAESAHGLIPFPVGVTWPWGDALAVLDRIAPAARVINLETSVTGGGRFDPGKLVHYRMAPANLPCVAAVRPDVCVLANNHVLDFGRAGLLDTLAALGSAGLRTAGAGRTVADAIRPAVVPLGDSARLLVCPCGLASSGIPPSWAATRERPGVAFAHDVTDALADELARRIAALRRPGDIAVVSLHWGGNWGQQVDSGRVAFAHRLVDGGVDIVHGHSSHHPAPVEVYRGRLVLYGCGDLVNDYEGITGHESFRPDLRVLYAPRLRPDGELAELRMTVLRVRRMRLERARHQDVLWLAGTLRRISLGFGTAISIAPDDTIVAMPR